MKKTIIANSQVKSMKANFEKKKKVSTPDHYKSSKTIEKYSMFNSP